MKEIPACFDPALIIRIGLLGVIILEISPNYSKEP